MAVQDDELYSDVVKLLTDICKFFDDESVFGKLSPSARKQANELIARSKVQLEEINKISVDSNGYDGGAYVDMEKKPDYDEDEEEIYTTVDEQKIEDTPPIVVERPSNPYFNLPAKDLSHDLKYGTLSWKCKIILKFEKIRRIFAGVHNNWLLIYSNERDVKPLHCLYLKFHKAHVVVTKQNKSSLRDFELTSTFGERRTYYLIAQTHKDMLQWITQINKCYDVLNQSSPAISEENISETYEPIINDSENSFAEMKQNNKTISKQPPDLPARPGFKLYPLPKAPKVVPEEVNSTSSTYDSVEAHEDEQNYNSFSSESEEEAVYEPFVARKETKEVRPNPIPNIQSNLATVLNKPKTPVKPKALMDTTKYFPPLRKQMT